jgi:hypothetical protein
VIPYGTIDRDEQASVAIQQEFINGLAEPVTVALRMGMPFIIGPITANTRRRFLIRTTIEIRGDTIQETAAIIGRLSSVNGPVLQALKLEYENKSRSSNIRQPIRIVLEHSLTRETLRQYGNSVYHRDSDCAISVGSHPEGFFHPASDQGALQETIRNNTPDPVRDGGVLFAIEIVDNLGKFGDRFIQIANEVYAIPAKKDESRADGIYVTRSDPVVADCTSGEIKASYYKFMNAEGVPTDFSFLNIYPTFVEAKTLGDVAGEKRKELADLDHKLQVGKREIMSLQQENERLKQDGDRKKEEFDAKQAAFDAEIAERERRYRELEVERDRIKHEMELQRLRAKDEYEEKSAKRKDTSEVIKMLPSIVAGGIALISLAVAIFKKS